MESEILFTVITKACHWTKTWARRIQSTLSHPYLLTYLLNL